jgi:hypothetical protein
MCFLAIWTSSFEKALFSSFARLFMGSLILGELKFFELPGYMFFLICRKQTQYKFKKFMKNRLC